jgi:hypothetical protein
MQEAGLMRLMLSAMLPVAVACAPTAASPSPTAASPTVDVATATLAGTAQPTTAAGTIAGVVGYPSEGHPDLRVYALSTTDRRVFFVSALVPRAAEPPRPPYTITGVRPGTYHLMAYTEGSDRAGGAYTEYVRCGLRASCTDHTPIVVIVRAGETVRDIEVSDWYAPPGTFPERPR